MEIDALRRKNDGSNPSICEGEVSTLKVEPQDSEVPDLAPASLARKESSYECP